ncbi:MAG: CUAEP/CCAEP-tail radical SAM (seleno)protein, partial [Bryobacteraceae bacterium]
MKIILLAAYEMGRQPFGLASPAAILRREGHEVHCTDLAIDRLPAQELSDAGLVAFHLPMHTATRLAVPVIRTVGAINPAAHLSAYGLYAPLNETLLRSLGVSSIFGGEFEPLLAALARRLDRGDTVVQPGAEVSFDRVDFAVPDRTGLPGLDRYARLLGAGSPRIAGYTEASRGCKHRCRHCPVVPVYEGAFRIVPVEVVLADVRNQVQAGARHITFGDPD